LGVEEAVGLATSSSLELRNMGREQEAAALSYNLGLRGFLPSLSLNYSDGRQVRPGGADSDSLQAGLTLSQPLFDGGAAFKQRQLAAVQLRLKAAQGAMAAEALRDQVWSLFHKALLEREKQSLKEELFRVSAEQLEISRTEFRLGSLIEVELLGAEAELRAQELGLLEAESGLGDILWQLKMLLGLDPETEIALEGKLDREYAGLRLRNDPEALYALALERNLELGSLRAQSLQARTQYELSGMDLIPTFGLEATASLSGSGPPMQNPSFSAKLTVGFPFQAAPGQISLGASSAAEGQYGRSLSVSSQPVKDLSFLASRPMARAQAAAQAEKLRQAEEQLRYSIKKGLAALALRRRSLDLSRETLAIEKRRLAIMEKQLELGEMKRVEYLKAQAQHYDRENALLEGVYSLILDERALEKSAGLGIGGLAAELGEARP
jgi:outer membrane protein TolC